jgi:SAM-dependent methyltransferase
VNASKGRSGVTIPSDYWRRLYRTTEDPWSYATSTYEREKYETTLAALPKSRYRHALELGCSIGVFTRMLAERCAALLAVDVSDDALARAALRCTDAPHVRFASCDLSRAFPPGRYDLVTFCELGFFFSPATLARIRDDIAAALEPGGECILVHWTPLVEGHAQTADDVHDAFLADPRYARLGGTRATTYRLDLVRRT